MSKKEGWLSVRLTPELTKTTRKLARQEGLSISDFVRTKYSRSLESSDTSVEQNLDPILGVLEELSAQMKQHTEKQERLLKGLSTLPDRIASLQELVFQSVSLQLKAIGTFASSVSEIEWMTYALTMASEDQRTQSRITTNYGFRRDKTAPTFKKLTEDIDNLRRQYAKK